jgi:hypothetical protein
VDQLDVNLLDAWNRIGARVREDRIEALRRAKRHFTNALRRPMRAWCLCIRASDTRISAWNAIIDPLPEPSDDGTSFIGNWSDVEEARRSTDDGWHPGVADDVSELVTRGLPHVVTLSGKVIRELTRPVRIPWPGEDWKVAAAKLGRHHYTLRGWMRHGVLQTRREYSRPHGYRGKPLPIVWSPTPLDPNAHEGRAPDPIWGTLWQWMWEQLPEDLFVDRGARSERAQVERAKRTARLVVHLPGAAAGDSGRQRIRRSSGTRVSASRTISKRV